MQWLVAQLLKGLRIDFKSRALSSCITVRTGRGQVWTASHRPMSLFRVFGPDFARPVDRPFLKRPWSGHEPTDPHFDLDRFITACVSFALDSKDLSAYQAKYLRIEPDLFPPPEQGNLRDDDALRRRLGLAMVRAVWCALPLPALDFACPKAPSPERNSPCYCGSGRKFNQCCEPITRNVPLQDVDLLPQVLAAVPRRTWKALSGSRVDIDRIAHVADECRRIGERQFVAVTEPTYRSCTSSVVLTVPPPTRPSSRCAMRLRRSYTQEASEVRLARSLLHSAPDLHNPAKCLLRRHLAARPVGRSAWSEPTVLSDHASPP